MIEQRQQNQQFLHSDGRFFRPSHFYHALNIQLIIQNTGTALNHYASGMPHDAASVCLILSTLSDILVILANLNHYLPMNLSP